MFVCVLIFETNVAKQENTTLWALTVFDSRRLIYPIRKYILNVQYISDAAYGQLFITILQIALC